jgi:hypothetical protein
MEGLLLMSNWKVNQSALTDDVELVGEWFANCYAASLTSLTRWPHAPVYVDRGQSTV